MKNFNHITFKTLIRSSMILLLMLSFSVFSIAQKLQLTQEISPDKTRKVTASSGNVLYSQVSPENAGLSSQDFEPVNDAFDSQGVDDFIVPVEDTDGWYIISVKALGSNQGTPFTLVNVEFFNDAGGIPAATAFTTYMAIVATDDGSGNLSVNIPNGGLHLNAGHYWMSVQAANPAGTHGQWYWHRVTSVNNTVSHWRNPGNGFDTGFTTWTPEVVVFDGPAEDLAFEIYGVTSVPLSNWPIFLGVFLIGVFVIIRFNRRKLA